MFEEFFNFNFLFLRDFFFGFIVHFTLIHYDGMIIDGVLSILQDVLNSISRKKKQIFIMCHQLSPWSDPQSRQ